MALAGLELELRVYGNYEVYHSAGGGGESPGEMLIKT